MNSPWITEADLAKIRDRHLDIDQEQLDEDPPPTQGEPE